MLVPKSWPKWARKLMATSISCIFSCWPVDRRRELTSVWCVPSPMGLWRESACSKWNRAVCTKGCLVLAQGGGNCTELYKALERSKVRHMLNANGRLRRGLPSHMSSRLGQNTGCWPPVNIICGISERDYLSTRDIVPLTDKPRNRQYLAKLCFFYLHIAYGNLSLPAPVFFVFLAPSITHPYCHQH